MRYKVVLLAASLAASAALSGCGSEPPPPEASYAPLHADYLNKLRLAVGTIEVQNNSVPLGPSDVAAQSPVPLAQAAEQIARERLFAGALTGTASFVIDQASIIQGPDGVLTGQLAVHLSIFGPNGDQTGFAQARVTSTHAPGSEPENLRTELYNMTKKMFDDMNVELEFQVRRNLRAFLVSAPVGTPVTATPLDQPPAGGAPPVPASPPPDSGAEMPPAPPAPAAGGAPTMSPPPGFLRLPEGYQPQ